ncbi:MAG: DNA cytosine methyltransferase [Myxococcota bacterium]
MTPPEPASCPLQSPVESVLSPALTAVSLFSGAGGLDLGLEAAGFRTLLCVECDADARATLKKNRPWTQTAQSGWRLSDPGDIHDLARLDDVQILEQVGLKPGELHLLAGGPPCQPFSKSGYWASGDSKRLKDPRAETLTAYLHLVELLQPKVVLLENVRGLAYKGKDEGMALLRKELEAINMRRGTRYNPTVFTLDAADFGVPQHRERVFLVASREGQDFTPPAASHGGEGQPSRVTTWEAIGDMDGEPCPPELKATGKWAALLPSIPEGENYLWHTARGGGQELFGWRTRFWSFLLKLSKSAPSWTIQASPGPATGPFHWRSRLLSTQEILRLQTFPDGYQIVGDRRSAQRQVGNAVPCLLAEVIGEALRCQFFEGSVRARMSLQRPPIASMPGPEPVAAVPEVFLRLRGTHAAHPGEGLGPGARSRTTATDTQDESLALAQPSIVPQEAA